MSEENPLGSDGLHGFYAVDVTGSITLLVGEPPQWKIGFYKLSQDITQPGNIGQLRLFPTEEAMQGSDEPTSERLIDHGTTLADVTGEIEGALFCFLLEAQGERMFFSCKNASDKAMWITGLKMFAKPVAPFSAKSLFPSASSAHAASPPGATSHSESPSSGSPAAAAAAKVDVMKFADRLDCFPELCTRLEHAWKASRSVVEFYKERAEIEMQCAKAISKLHKDTSEKSLFNKHTITELEIAPSVAMAWTALEVQTSAAAEGHRSFSLKVAAIASDLAGFLKERGDKRKQCGRRHCIPSLHLHCPAARACSLSFHKTTPTRPFVTISH
jgi:hypothetical protein